MQAPDPNPESEGLLLSRGWMPAPLLPFLPPETSSVFTGPHPSHRGLPFTGRRQWDLINEFDDGNSGFLEQ